MPARAPPSTPPAGRSKRLGSRCSARRYRARPLALWGRRRASTKNAVVSYNLKAIRERQGWTQQEVADRLAQLTGHTLPQASISAMERGFDGERRRRFDAHELYLLSVLFDVPIVYFFVPPPDSERAQLADTGRPVTELYTAVLGHERQLAPVDERLSEIGIKNPDEADQALVAILGAKTATGAWHDHFRVWRKRRLRQV